MDAVIIHMRTTFPTLLTHERIPHSHLTMEQSCSSSRIVTIGENETVSVVEPTQRSQSRKWSRSRFRRRKILSPLARGFLLAGVFGLWIVMSLFTGRDEGEGRAEPGWSDTSWRVRTLLNASEQTTLALPEGQQGQQGQHCVPPAIEQFPKVTFLSRWAGHQNVRLAVQILLAVYMFAGLAIVCDDYFVPSLERISDALNLPPDVAGATFMAAGSSAPELATAVIGVFVAQDDIGVSGVIGSAVFNIMLVIAACALATNQVLHLNWWPIVRDCSCYLISILVLFVAIEDETVTWPEAVFFLVLYVLYCVAMTYSPTIEVWLKQRLPVPESWNTAGKMHDQKGNYESVDTSTAKTNGVPQKPIGLTSNGIPATSSSLRISLLPSNPEQNVKDPIAKEAVDESAKGNSLELAQWFVLCPLYLVCKCTIPDCSQERFSRLYFVTFLMSIAWISLFSYVMVWMITAVGYTLGIPDTVMGLTFIAAGVSVPDALSSVAVVREGQGDMAVSNAIGSNVFDILVCLGVPWFLQTIVVQPGSHVRVRSKGLVYSTFSLFSTVFFLLVASHCNGWRLNRRYGLVLLLWYFIFIILASMYELNIFGQFNPPQCQTN